MQASVNTNNMSTLIGNSSVIDKSFCVIGTELHRNERLMHVIRGFDANATCVTEEEASTLNSTSSMVYVVPDFESELFERINKPDVLVFGPSLILQLSPEEPLHLPTRSVFCTSMQDVVVCFTGFKDRDPLRRIVSLAHYMGSKFRKAFSPSVTHLIANNTRGEKYRYAVNLSRPVMRIEWIEELWNRRMEPELAASDENLIAKYHVQPLFSCIIAFVGFPEEEMTDMVGTATKNGATICEMEDPACTHIVVDEQSQSLLPPIPDHVYCVRTEWFWSSIQLDARAAEDVFRVTGVSFTKDERRSSIVPFGRKRRIDSLQRLLEEEASADMSSFLSNNSANCPDSIGPSPEKIKKSARHMVCGELLQTETNYVNILHTIITKFKTPLEEDLQKSKNPLLNAQELKCMFGNLPPIFEVHTKILKDLEEVMVHWREDAGIGRIILSHSEGLMKSYPPFVNFLEETKRMIQTCDKNNIRFHAFLKICQTKPECYRQNLVDLLIRPVQRLPSMILLLQDILKQTSKSSEDYSVMEKAIQAVKNVTLHINEDKRRTEARVRLFEIVNDIENCPAVLLSSHRAFITSVEVIELSDTTGRQGENLALFVFNDQLEICKRRRNKNELIRYPSTESLSQMSRHMDKSYKHIELISLTSIQCVWDILQSGSENGLFALSCRPTHDLRDRMYVFSCVDDGLSKTDLVTCLCNLLANVSCVSDPDQFLMRGTPQQLQGELGDTLLKAMKFASKSSQKVSRAASVKRSAQQRLRRGFNSLFSPFRTSTTSLQRFHTASSTLDISRLRSNM